MASENLECPAAKRWLLPYLAGRLEGSDEGVAFEKHVLTCPACKELVSDRRKAMQTLLVAAVENEETPQPIRPVKPETAVARLTKNKTTLFFGAAALALVGFSYVMRPGNEVLGEKLSALPPAPPKTATAPAQKPTAKPGLNSQIEKTQAAEKASAKPVKTRAPKVKPAIEPKPIRHNAKAQPKPKNQFIKPKTERNSVEVFDATGRRIGYSQQKGKKT